MGILAKNIILKIKEEYAENVDKMKTKIANDFINKVLDKKSAIKKRENIQGYLQGLEDGKNILLSILDEIAKI